MPCARGNLVEPKYPRALLLHLCAKDQSECAAKQSGMAVHSGFEGAAMNAPQKWTRDDHAKATHAERIAHYEAHVAWWQYQAALMRDAARAIGTGPKAQALHAEWARCRARKAHALAQLDRLRSGEPLKRAPNVERIDGLSAAQIRALTVMAAGERPKGSHVAELAKLGYTEKYGSPTSTSNWKYRITQAGLDWLARNKLKL